MGWLFCIDGMPSKDGSSGWYSSQPLDVQSPIRRMMLAGNESSLAETRSPSSATEFAEAARPAARPPYRPSKVGLYFCLLPAHMIGPLGCGNLYFRQLSTRPQSLHIDACIDARMATTAHSLDYQSTSISILPDLLSSRHICVQVCISPEI